MQTGVIDVIGNTPSVPLRRLVPPGGASLGANVVAALGLPETLGPQATVVTLMCDSGIK